MPHDQPLKGILFYCMNILCFSLISVLVKELSVQIAITELLFIRFVFPFSAILLLIRSAGGWAAIRPRKLIGHGVRTCCGMLALGLCFLALSLGQMAEVTALMFCAPLFVVLLSALVLAEKISPSRLLAVFLGLLGILLITRPGISDINPGHIAAVGSALFFSVVSVMLRKLNRTEHPLSSSLVYNFTGTLVFISWTSLQGWTTSLFENTPLLILLGITGVCQQLLLTYSFRYADASLLAGFDYLSLPLSLTIGFIWWSEVPDHFSLIILLSGFGLALREQLFK